MVPSGNTQAQYYHQGFLPFCTLLSAIAFLLPITVNNIKQFLETVQLRMPFPVRAVQVDGGWEFIAGFEKSYQEKGIHLFVLPPRSPKLNGCVERAHHRTHAEEFNQVYADNWDLLTLPKIVP